MRFARGFAAAAAAVMLVLLAGSLQPAQALDSLSVGFIRYYDDGTHGTLDLSDGNTWVLSFDDLDFNSYSGTFEIVYGDRGSGSGWESFLIKIVTHSSGAGGHLIEAYDEDGTTLMTSHALAAGEGSTPFDLRLVLSQNVDNSWHIAPFYRLSAGTWTSFSGGPFDGANQFDLNFTHLTMQFGAAGTGTAFFEPATAQAGNILSSPSPQNLTFAGPTQTVDFEYVGGGSGLVYGYSVKFTWDGAVATTAPVLVAEGPLLSDQGTTLFFADSTGPNEITVDAVLLGAQPGVSGPASMFTVDFTGIACDTSVIDVTIVSVVDKDNQGLTGFSEADGLLLSDITIPIFSVNGPFPEGECWNTTPILDVSAIDVCSDLDLAQFRVDGGGWLTDAGLFAAFVGNSFSNPTWSFPLFALVGEGAHVINFRCFDDFGNVSTVPSWSFIKDTINPPAATVFDATAGNGKVHLAWTNPLTDFDHVEVVRKPWSAGAPFGYPEYVQPADGYPATGIDGTIIYSGTAETFEDTLTARSIYYYRSYTYDCAGNLTGGFAPTTAIPAQFGQGDRATNYWLGDVTSSGGGYDGEVDFFDLNALSAGYRKYSPSSPPIAPDDELDVGPTDNASRLGLPVPDDDIDFPDLVIFAMNYTVVAPSGKALPIAALDNPGEAGQPTLVLERRDNAEESDLIEVELSLQEHVDQVKAASVVLSYDKKSLDWIETRSGSGLADPEAQVFLQSGEMEQGKVWIDLAVLGRDRVLHGSGELATLVFRVKNDRDLDITFESADLRDAENTALNASTSDLALSGNSTVPGITRLVGARPNPFNPTTSIRYELKSRTDVRIQIYDVQGRLVNTLVSESKDAGSYEATWNGVDSNGKAVGSGSYFVRMRSGGYESTNKILMLR